MCERLRIREDGRRGYKTMWTQNPEPGEVFEGVATRGGYSL
jgi:hypothetical protein